MTALIDKAWELDIYYDRGMSWDEQRRLQKAVKGEWIGGGGGPTIRSHSVFVMSDCDKAMKQGEAIVKKFSKANVSFVVRGRYTGAVVSKCPPGGRPPKGPNAPAYVPEAQQLVRENVLYTSPYGSKAKATPRPRAQGSGTRADFYRSPYEPDAPRERAPRVAPSRSSFYVSPYSSERKITPREKSMSKNAKSMSKNAKCAQVTKTYNALIRDLYAKAGAVYDRRAEPAQREYARAKAVFKKAENKLRKTQSKARAEFLRTVQVAFKKPANAKLSREARKCRR